MPAFNLPDGGGTYVTSDACTGTRGTVVMFICNHCPFVVHIAEGLAALGRDWADSEIGLVAISSNDVSTHPDDSPAQMMAFSARHGLSFPYLFDETQQVAKAFNAACTPDFFLYNANGLLMYRGQFDSARPGSDVPVSGDALRAAMQAIQAGKNVPDDQVPSMGCNIKWKATD